MKQILSRRDASRDHSEDAGYAGSVPSGSVEAGQSIHGTKAFEVIRRTAGASFTRSQLLSHFEMALSHMPVGMAAFDSTEKLIFANEKFGELLGLANATVQPGISLRNILCSSLDADALESMHEQLSLTGYDSSRQELSGLPGIGKRTLSLSKEALQGGGWIATVEDISERRTTELLLQQMAHYDVLTAIPNRVTFLEHLRRAAAQASRGVPFAILTVDLDDLKYVNETLGHPAGDDLLRTVARRLNANVRDGDTVARIGGDDFAILQFGVSEPKAAEVLALRILKVLNEPFELCDRELMIGASIGIALAPQDGCDVDELLKNADLALQRSRYGRTSPYCFYDEALDQQLSAKRMLEQDLRHALHGNEFAIEYQPLVDLGKGRVVGYEALLRWHHPTRGVIAPSEFIPAAEKNGLIVPIGEWVLTTSILAATIWPRQQKVSINVSAAQLRSPGFAEMVQYTLTRFGMSAERLELEITESTVMQNCEITRTTLQALRTLGVRIALDDFGTGFSSISYLRDFPFDRIKIDQSFIRCLPEDTQSSVLVKAIVALAKNFNMAVTAEGIETLDQLRFLQSVGCNEAQGYLFGRPLPAATPDHRHLPISGVESKN